MHEVLKSKITFITTLQKQNDYFQSLTAPIITFHGTRLIGDWRVPCACAVCVCRLLCAGRKTTIFIEFGEDLRECSLLYWYLERVF